MIMYARSPLGEDGGVTVPAWVWAVTAAGLIAAVAAEIVLTRHGSFTARSALRWIACYVSLAVIFGLAVGIAVGWLEAGQFYAGYLTEYSLSLDNLFVFYVIMSRLAVPQARQHSVLLWGIGLALALRSGLIIAGAAAINRYDWLFYPMGAVLIWTAIGLFTGGNAPEEHTRLTSWLQRHVLPPGAGGEGGRRLVTWRSGRLMVAANLLVILAIGVADVVFAVDSIPAVFGITTSAYLVVACNAFALMGLRQVYVLLARLLERISYLNIGLAVILMFIGVKLLLQAAAGSGAGWAVEIPAWLSLVVVVAVLAITVIAGVIRGGRERTTLQRRFAVIDTGGNGVWRRDDYEQLARRLCQACGRALDSVAGRAAAAAQRALFDALLAHMDANGDQEISLDEFAAAAGRPIEDRPGFDAAIRTAAHAIIQVADRDGNGVLDAGEYTQLTRANGASAEEAARAFGRLDLDHNGVLDTAELAAAIGEFFASRDAGARGNLVFGRL
jgi:tellurite resistance protein TerC